jgi:hypothetical protein
MDANLFRLPTTPDYYASQRVDRPSISSGLPAPDSRFPGWAATLQDGRLVTDYRSSREKNIPVEAQEKTRIWLQRNGDEIIRLSRKRAAETTGMAYGIDQTLVPPAATYVNCTSHGCTIKKGSPNGIGVERVESTPDLFGTYEPGISFMQAPLPKVHVTRRYEGGRNSYRG